MKGINTMKKSVYLLVILFCLATINIVFANIEINNENKFGLELDYSTNEAYPGDINIDGLYVHQDKTDYIFTIAYSNGDLVNEEYNDKPKVKTSFFNPGDGDIVQVSWIKDFEKITESKQAIHYRVDKELFEQVKMITVFLFDVKFDNNDENMSVYFKTNVIDFDKIPDVNTLIAGYQISNVQLHSNLETDPASWALKSIEELQVEGIIRDEAFSQFSQGITRERFACLMVNLFEELTGYNVVVSRSISFEDSVDPYVLKAASIGITSGIGDNKFGPDIILNREQMTTFLIKTLNIAKVDIESGKSKALFADDEEMSDWAKDSIYTAKSNGIMNGLGDNKFSPKSEATNEQALYIVHDLLKKYASLEYLNEYNSERVYFKFEEELYQIPLESNVVVGENNDDVKLYLTTIEDTNIFLNTLMLKAKDLSYVASPNPNFKGLLEAFDYEKMTVFVENIYSGVDKSGEVTTMNFGSDFNAQANLKLDSQTIKYKNFDTLKYYDLNNKRQVIDTLPIKKIANSFDLEYKITFNDSWNIYIVEILEAE